MTAKLNVKQCLMAGLYAGAAAAIINAILFLIFHGAGVISDTIFPQPNQPLTIVPVIMASIIPLLIGSLIFFLFEKFTKNGLTIFTVAALLLMMLSLYSPFAVIPGVTTGYALVLCAMHIVPALALLFFLRREKAANSSQRFSETI